MITYEALSAFAALGIFVIALISLGNNRHK